MIGTYSDIQTMEKNLSAMVPTVEMVKAVDADLAQPKPPHGNKPDGFEAYARFWQETHPNNKPGNILISVLCKEGPESPLTDPVDLQVSGLKSWIAAHTPGAGPTEVA
jgi:hypothetical protein